MNFLFLCIYYVIIKHFLKHHINVQNLHLFIFILPIFKTIAELFLIGNISLHNHIVIFFLHFYLSHCVKF